MEYYVICNYIQDFVKGKISRNAFWKLAKSRYPTHNLKACYEQIEFLNKKNLMESGQLSKKYEYNKEY